jgi:hypothetical protein
MKEGAVVVIFWEIVKPRRNLWDGARQRRHWSQQRVRAVKCVRTDSTPFDRAYTLYFE